MPVGWRGSPPPPSPQPRAEVYDNDNTTIITINITTRVHPASAAGGMQEASIRLSFLHPSCDCRRLVARARLSQTPLSIAWSARG